MHSPATSLQRPPRSRPVEFLAELSHSWMDPKFLPADAQTYRSLQPHRQVESSCSASGHASNDHLPMITLQRSPLRRTNRQTSPQAPAFGYFYSSLPLTRP